MHVSCRLAIVCIILFVVAPIARAADPGVVVEGGARFTIITPNLIRIEYERDRKFIDDRSMFAVERAARFADAKVTNDARSLVIDTGPIRLSYIKDNEPLSPQNLKAEIRRGNDWIAWQPGAANAGNLGGTVRTLDRAVGPLDLGQGVLSRDGWVLLDDSRTPLLTENWVRARPKDAGTDWYLFGYGSDYRAALKSLAAIGGRVPLPRKYLLGAWYSRFWPYTSDDYRNIVREYEQHDFPLDVIVMDMDWHITHIPKQTQSGQIWTGYTWDRKLLPDAEALIQWFHAQGLHVTLNDHPAQGVQSHESMYADFMHEMNEDPAAGKTIPFDAGDQRYLDTFWKQTHQPMLDAGVDFWWLDWQQFPFTRGIGELTNLAWLNRYYYQHTTSDTQRGTSFSRWAGWGDHRHPIHFSGDADTGWPMLAFEIPFTSVAGNIGCFFWSHDIGGHTGGRNEESYARWCQFGALSAALRSHSTRSAMMDRRPWTYPKWAEDSMRRSFHLRSELFPYIYSSAAQSCRETVPMIRPMYIDSTSDEHAYHNPQQYLFGDHLMVAPIASPGVGTTRIAQQAVWFPPGDAWFNFFTGERFEGRTERLIAADINEFPLFVRAGVPMPMQPYQSRMATAKLESLVVRCYPGEEGKRMTSTLYEDDGLSPQYERGEFTTTDLSAIRQRGHTIITVGPTKGRFDGAVTNRTLIIELPQTSSASAVMVDGKPLDRAQISYDAAKKVNRIRFAMATLDKSCIVDCECEVVGNEVADKPVVGLFAKNISPVGAAGELAYVFYAPPGAVDGDSIRWTLGDSPEQTMALDRSGATVLNLPSPKKRSFDSPTIRVDYSIGGEKRSAQLATVFDPSILADASNVARQATASASSSETGYTPAGAIDGRPDGFPHSKRFEWSSNREKIGATLKLQWKEKQAIDTILLFDRPNLTDQIASAVIEFDDGTSVKVGPLPNDGRTPLAVQFEPKTIQSLTLRVTGVSASTQNAGLSEIAVFRRDAP